MARNFEDLGGIGVRIVADARTIKRDFQAELGSLQSAPVKIPIQIDDRGKIAELRKQLAGLDVPISVKVNRETARSLKRSIQGHLEQEPVQIPIKARGPSATEISTIRGEILDGLGDMTATVTLNWQWGQQGPPPEMGGPGGPQGPTGGAPGGGGGWYWRPRAGGPTAGTPRETDMGPVAGGVNPLANPHMAAAAAIAAARATARVPEALEPERPASGRGSGRRRASSLSKQADEDDAAHATRLTQLYAQHETAFKAAEQGSRDATLAYNRMVDIRKRPEMAGVAGMEGPTTRLPLPRKGEESTYPLRVDAFGNAVRGGPKVGPLVGEAASSRRRIPAPAQGLTDAELTAAVRERYGIEFDEAGGLIAVGQNAPRARDIERHAASREFAAVRSGMGFRGQRASRSPFGEGLDLTPEQIEQRRAASFAAVEAGTGPTPEWQKFVSGLQREGGRFISKEARGAKYRELLGPAFAEGEELLGQGELGQAMRVVGARRGELLGGAFAKSGTPGAIPGVGPATAKRFLDKKRGLGGEETPEQFAWFEEMGGLDAISGEIYARIERLRGQGRQEAGNEQRAMTLRGETFGQTPTALTQGAGNVGFGGTTPTPGGFYARPMTPREIRSQQRAPTGPQDPVAQLYDEIEGLASRLESARMPAMQGRIPGAQETGALEEELANLTPEIEALREAQEQHTARLEATTPIERATEAGVTVRTQRARERREGGRIEEELGGRQARAGEIQRRLSLRDLEPQLEAELAAKTAQLQQRMAAQEVVPQPEPEVITTPLVEQAIAAGPGVPPSVPPGVMGPGGEGEWVWGGEGPPPGGGPPGVGFAGGGGPVHVIVDNFPAWMESQQGMAGGPVTPGMTPGEQEQATRGGGEPIPAEDIQAAVEEAERIVSAKPGKIARPTQTPLQFAQQLMGAGGFPLGVEPVGEILAPPQPGRGGGRAGAFAGRAADIETQLAMSRQGLPIRGFATSVAQELAGGPRGEIFTRFSRAAENLREAERMETTIGGMEQKIDAADESWQQINQHMKAGNELTEEQVKLYTELPDKIDEMTESLFSAREEQKGLVDEADQWSKLTGGERIANLGKSLVGSIAGFTAYTAAISASGAALGLAAIGVTDYLERVGGYQQATRQITGTLAEQTRASGGAAEQTVAQTAAQANLTMEQYETVRAALEERAATESSNKAYEDQQKLRAASRNVEGQQREIGGQRFDKGLFDTTGGLVIPGLNIETPLMGTPSTQELVARDIEAAFEPLKQFTGVGILPGTGAMAGMLNPEEMEAAFAQYTADLDTLNKDFVGTGIKFVAATAENADASYAVRDAFRDAGLTDIAQQMEAGRVAVPEGTDLSPQRLAQAMQMVQERRERPDPEVMLAAMRERILPAVRFQIEEQARNMTQIFIPAQRAMQFLANPVPSFGRGFMPLGERGEGGVRAPLTGTEAVPGLTTQAAPMVGGGPTPEVTTRFGGVPQSTIDTWDKYADEAQASMSRINALAAEGEAVLRDKLGVPQESIDQLRAYGQGIDDLRQQQANIRTGFELTQYNRQLSLAQRTLGDIAGLTGREGGTYIGQLQRQDMLLSRRASMLSLQTAQLGLQTQELGLQSAELGQQQSIMQLELQQRRVNFQRAIAGFTAPGTTPEERAARIEEARVEADYAQREIDFGRSQLTIQQKVLVINREQFALQQASVGLSMQQLNTQIALTDAVNNRSYQDQLDTIAEMQAGREASDEIAALEEGIHNLETERDLFQQILDVQIESETKFINTLTEFTTDLMSKTGVFTTEVVNQVADVFEDIRTMPSPFPSWMTGGTGGTSTNSTSGTSGVPGGQEERPGLHVVQPPPSDEDEQASTNAAGFAGRISSPTRMLVGEAGPEEVAILRNPRSMMLGGGGGDGGGGTTIQVLVTGNTVTNEAEEDRLAQKVAALVQDILSRRTSTFGLFSSR